MDSNKRYKPGSLLEFKPNSKWFKDRSGRMNVRPSINFEKNRSILINNINRFFKEEIKRDIHQCYQCNTIYKDRDSLYDHIMLTGHLMVDIDAFNSPADRYRFVKIENDTPLYHAYIEYLSTKSVERLTNSFSEMNLNDLLFMNLSKLSLNDLDEQSSQDTFQSLDSYYDFIEWVRTNKPELVQNL